MFEGMCVRLKIAVNNLTAFIGMEETDYKNTKARGKLNKGIYIVSH